MSYPTPRVRRLRVAPILFVVLGITTGWAQPQTHPVAFPASAAIHQASAVAHAIPTATSNVGPQGRVARPQREAAAVASTATQPAVHVAVARTYSGRNHFWFPALGISRQVYSFPCSRKQAPANLVYRWGCAGANNVYILGHAYGVMKPLHDAYVSGRLHTGMVAIYADAKGNIRTYQVTSWRLVRPTNGAWAEASQSVPSMTLQTCVGAQSQWRLIVRLVALD